MASLRTALASIVALSVLSIAPAVADAATRDVDHDGLSGRYEVKRSHTSPRLADTDRDRLSDGFEVRASRTDPRRMDTDRDGLTDGYELRQAHTSPRRLDTDRDGTGDGLELLLGTDPTKRGKKKGIVVNPPADTTPPDTAISSGPSGTVATSDASFAFTSTETGSFECSVDANAWADCASPIAYSGFAYGAHSFSVRARDAAGNTDASPATRTWTVAVPPPPPPADTTPPDTTISGGPSDTSTSASASFTFTSSEAGSTFQCRLDAGTWGNCASPKAYSGLANGSHTFNVRATDAANNTDASPATRTWTVAVPPPPADTTPPDTTITGGPSDTSTSASASFTFTSSEAGSTFQCRLDAGTWGNCSSPKAYSGLANGSHTFNVRATDAANNTDASPATRTWTVAVPPPPPPPPGGCAVTTPNVADGPDPWGGCFPGPSNTGVPDHVTLTSYNGPCAITAPNTVIDGKLINCGLDIRTSGVIIRNSRVNGRLVSETAGSSVTITDSLVDAGDVNSSTNDGPRALNGHNFTAIRVETIRGISGGFCDVSCEVRDSWIHAQDRDEGGQAHASGFRQGDGLRFTHNSVVCEAPTVGEAGCSADITGYGDFATIENNVLERNLLMATPGGGFCAYGGSSKSKPFSNGQNNTWRDNIFQRGPSGKCGVYGPMTDLDAGVRGNVWTNNRWSTGELVASG